MSKLPPYICLGLVTLTSHLSAVIVASESFDYTSGVDIAGQTGGTPTGSPGWNGSAWSNSHTSGTETFNATSSGLTFTDGNGNTLVSSGNAMIEDEQTGSNSSYRRAYETPSGFGDNGTEAWVSYRVDIGGSGSHGFQWGHPSGNLSQVQIYRVNFAGSTNTWRLQIGGNTTDLTDADGISASGDYLVIMKVDYQSGTDPTSVWFVENGTGNISSEATLGTPDLFLNTNGVSANNTVTFYAGNFPSSVTYDELRVGTTFADVAPIPEVKAFALISGLMTLGLVFTRRRR